MEVLGTLAPRPASAIAASRIGVGFECLERRMWDDTAALYRLVGDLGVKHARVQTGWFRCETEPGVYDFSWLDAVATKLLAQGVRPWFSLGYGNMLYTDAPAPDAAGYPPIYTPEARAAWTRFVSALVTHCRGRVTHYEIWNEPDAGGFWHRGVNEDEYLDLVRLTAPAIRAADPAAKVIGGALAMSLAWPAAFTVLKRYLDGGLVDHVDALTYHRYHVMPELQRPEDFAAVRALLDRYGGRHVEIWQGESGCPSRPSTTEALSNTPVDETVQAKVALRGMVNDLLYGADYTCWFHISDFKRYYRNGLIDVQNYFGLLTFDDPPRCKPAYRAVQCLANLFDGETTLDVAARLTFDRRVVPDAERFTFQRTLIRMKKGMFQRRGWPLAVWWLPEDIIPAVAGAAPYPGESLVAKPWSCARPLENPVVVDPMTGTVYAIPAADRFVERRGVGDPVLCLDGVPLRDYPMVLTDAAAIADIISPTPNGD